LTQNDVAIIGVVWNGCNNRSLLAFYDFPAEHWKHLRTSNPIESTFVTVRHRTIRSNGCLWNKTALAVVFKLVDAAPKS
jgi:transposase-like protein